MENTQIETPKMYLFYSLTKRPKITMKPLKTNKDGDILQEGKTIIFEDKFFQTADLKVAEFIRSLKNFNADYFEVDAISKLPVGTGYQGNQVGVAKMETPESKRENELSELKSQIADLTKMITNLAPKKAEGEVKILDKRSKEYKATIKEKADAIEGVEK